MKLAALTCLALAGCSFIAIRPTPATEYGKPHCGSYAFPALDALMIPAVESAAMLAALGTEPSTRTRDGAILGIASSGAVFAASAIYGAIAASNCKSKLR